MPLLDWLKPHGTRRPPNRGATKPDRPKKPKPPKNGKGMSKTL
jgi:hypothetical protein